MHAVRAFPVIYVVLFAAVLFATLGRAMTSDVEYTKAGNESLRLDACAPAADSSRPRPVAILIHGGGWMGGSKANAENKLWAGALEKANFAWFAINYRLAPAHRWPACLDDVRAAIRWVKTHAADYNGDPSRIVLFGYSAGGQLASLAALTAQPDMRVMAVVGCAPVTDFEQDLPVRGGLSVSLQNLFGLAPEKNPLSAPTLKLLRENSPLNAIASARSKGVLPRFLIIQGDADKTVPHQQSLNFQNRLCEAGGICDIITIPGGQHRIGDWEKYAPDWRDKLLSWLQSNVCGE